MATFDAAQITSLAEIFGTTSDEMSYWLDGREGIITEADKTSILADVTAHQAIEDDNINVTAGPAGFQGRISPSDKRSLIKKRIGALLGWQVVSGGGLVRG
jgi:hypothetical protein